MAGPPLVCGQIWQDDCYYLNPQGQCMRKYVLVLATDAGGDAVTAVFTSQSNGLTENPPCSVGPPRAGHFVGVPGGVFVKPTWVEFSSVEILDRDDFAIHVAQGRKSLLPQVLPGPVLCAILRCALQSDDITARQARWIADAAATLGCP